MDFTTIGSIGMIVRTMKMHFQWQEKSRTIIMLQKITVKPKQRSRKSMAVVNTVANNPAISGGKKLELLMQENAKVNAVNEAGYKFVESGKNGRLPTEEELNQEIHEEKEQERTDLEERKQDDSTEEMKPDETVQEEAKPPESIFNGSCFYAGWCRLPRGNDRTGFHVWKGWRKTGIYAKSVD